MTTRKTLRVPVNAEGLPVVADPRRRDRTRELAVDEAGGALEDKKHQGVEAAPQEIIDDEVTVPVHSSIESTLTYELLRRQSTQSDDDDDEADEKKP